MNGEKQVDLGELQRQRDKNQAALADVQSRIDAIEEKARLEREEAERKQSELASLQKKLVVCRETISWIDGKLTELKTMAQGQANLVLTRDSSAYFTLKASLQEIAEWEREVLVFREIEGSLPEEIAKLEAPTQR